MIKFTKSYRSCVWGQVCAGQLLGAYIRYAFDGALDYLWPLRPKGFDIRDYTRVLLRQYRHASLEWEPPVHLLVAFSGLDVAKALLHLNLLSVHLALQRARIPIDQNVLKIEDSGVWSWSCTHGC